MIRTRRSSSTYQKLEKILHQTLPGKNQEIIEKYPDLKAVIDRFFIDCTLDFSSCQKLSRKLPTEFWEQFVSSTPITLKLWPGFSTLEPGMEKIGPIAHLTVTSEEVQREAINLSHLQFAPRASVEIEGPGHACYLLPADTPLETDTKESKNATIAIDQVDYGLLRRHPPMKLPHLPEPEIAENASLHEEVDWILAASLDTVSVLQKTWLLSNAMHDAANSLSECFKCASAFHALLTLEGLSRFEFVLILERLMAGVETALKQQPECSSQLLALCMDEGLLNGLSNIDKQQWYTSVLRRVQSLGPVPPEDAPALQALVARIQGEVVGLNSRILADALAKAELALGKLNLV